MELIDCHVALSVSQRALIDYVDPDTGMSIYGQETLDSMRERFPDAEIVSSWEAVQRLIEKEFVQSPRPISRTEWNDMLLAHTPPVGRYGHGQTESFRLPDLVFGQTGVILARDGWRFYRLIDRIDLSHQEILAKCRALQ